MANIGRRGTSLLWWMAVFTVICIITLLLRLRAARVMRRPFYLDDASIAISFACILSFEGVAVWSILNGIGKHSVELSPEELATLGKILVLPSSITWLIGTVSIKISVLWLYTRIFSTRSFKKWAYILLVAVACYGIAFMALFMTICKPIDQLWNPVPGGHCRDTSIQEFTSVSFNLVLDLCIFILPMPWLWGLQMPRRNKLAISIMFGIGFVTIGVMCWRLKVTKQSVDNPDASYWLTDIGLIALLELWLGLIVACIPTLAPLLKAYVKPAISKLKTLSLRLFKPKQISLKNLKDSQSTRSYHVIDSNRDIESRGEAVRGGVVRGESVPGVELRTECSHKPVRGSTGWPLRADAIHVQQDIELC